MGLLNRSTELFLIDNAGNGGMALSPQEFGLSWGTVGAAALMTGVVMGAAMIRRFGLFHTLLPMAFAMALPGTCLLWLSTSLPYSLTITSIAIMLIQLTSGMAISPLLHVAGHFGRPDSHIPAPNMICISLAAIGLMAGSMVGGSLQDAMGYIDFYTLVTISATISVASSVAMIRAARLDYFSHGTSKK